jgi:hypothetical protein
MTGLNRQAFEDLLPSFAVELTACGLWNFYLKAA